MFGRIIGMMTTWRTTSPISYGNWRCGSQIQSRTAAGLCLLSGMCPGMLPPSPSQQGTGEKLGGHIWASGPRLPRVGFLWLGMWQFEPVSASFLPAGLTDFLKSCGTRVSWHLQGSPVLLAPCANPGSSPLGDSSLSQPGHHGRVWCTEPCLSPCRLHPLGHGAKRSRDDLRRHKLSFSTSPCASVSFAQHCLSLPLGPFIPRRGGT